MELTIEEKEEITCNVDSRTITYIRDSIENMSKYNQV